jgi:hypothetical protein
LGAVQVLSWKQLSVEEIIEQKKFGMKKEEILDLGYGSIDGKWDGRARVWIYELGKKLIFKPNMRVKPKLGQYFGGFSKKQEQAVNST